MSEWSLLYFSGLVLILGVCAVECANHHQQPHHESPTCDSLQASRRALRFLTGDFTDGNIRDEVVSNAGICHYDLNHGLTAQQQDQIRVFDRHNNTLCGGCFDHPEHSVCHIMIVCGHHAMCYNITGNDPRHRYYGCCNPVHQWCKPWTDENYHVTTCTGLLCNTGNHAAVQAVIEGIHPTAIDGAWSSWSYSAPCSETCGDGIQTKIRTCTNPAPQHGGKTCAGLHEAIVICTKGPCPIDGTWTDWTNLAECSETCGNGIQLKKRTCTHPAPQYGGKMCEGLNETFAMCTKGPCPPPPSQWGSWESWGACSVTCGPGQGSRSRHCLPIHAKCNGTTGETRQCSSGICPALVNWESWNQWNQCSASCGGGTTERTRHCPLSGNTCAPGGLDKTMAWCNAGPCFGSFWSDWSAWNQCSVTCEVGQNSRSRSCKGDGSPCSGRSHQTADCDTLTSCATWTTWSAWELCSVTCGLGTKARLRVCQGGNTCTGKTSENTQCDTGTTCPIVGTWSAWSYYGACSTTCGVGTMERTHQCQGGTSCPGNVKETAGCNIGVCPTASSGSQWEQWAPWLSCSVTCGTGITLRFRTCSGGSSNCPGDAHDIQSCNTNVQCSTTSFTVTVPVLVWGAWSVWNPCSVTCGTGVHTRTRTCSTGNTCQGSSLEKSSCNTQSCVVATTQHTEVSGWAAWDSWHHCSATCGQGEQIRMRGCLTGTSCTGNVFDKQSCNTNVACPGSTQATLTASTTMTGAVATWGSWTTSSCSVTCGFGQQSQFRVCSTGINTDCTGSASSNIICHPTNCP